MHRQHRFWPVEPEAFKTTRLMAGFSFAETAQMLHVTERTVRNWEAGRSRIPYSAFRLMKISAGFELPDPAWRDWQFRGDTLYSPDNKPFPVYDLNALSITFAKARLWDQNQLKQQRQTKKEPVQLELPGVARIWKVQAR